MVAEDIPEPVAFVVVEEVTGVFVVVVVVVISTVVVDVVGAFDVVVVVVEVFAVVVFVMVVAVVVVVVVVGSVDVVESVDSVVIDGSVLLTTRTLTVRDAPTSGMAVILSLPIASAPIDALNAVNTSASRGET